VVAIVGGLRRGAETSTRGRDRLIVAVPLPSHIDEDVVIAFTRRTSTASILHGATYSAGDAPAVPAGCIVIEEAGVDLPARRWFGRSNIVGKPVACCCWNATPR
jgi:5,10-methylene-tetrahydrofolate dehydrogenase/methenyl tetrahydrofolate cyclohydrolase